MKQPTLKRSNEVVIQIVPQSRLSRAFAAIAGLLLLALGLFFFTLFLAIGVVVLAVVIARVMWVTRHTKTYASNEIIEAEYSVEKKERDNTEQSRTEMALSDHQARNKSTE